MHLIRRALFAAMSLALTSPLLMSARPAAADDPSPPAQGFNSDGTKGDAEVWAKKQLHKPGKSGNRGRKPTHEPGSKDNQLLKKNEQQANKYFEYMARKRAFDACVTAGTGACGFVGDPVQFPTPLERGQIAGAPQISPQQAAIVAVARLHLDPPKPMIGPSPEINEWHIAAVGYPYWLWADGNLNPAPVSTTVADLTVRLDAHLQSTTFDLGDGSRLTCTDLTEEWTAAVEPGAASPVCGHTYTKPSLPKGKYTITAYSTWAVDWSVNGVGGTIPLYQQASTTLPVGELQVLTH